MNTLFLPRLKILNYINVFWRKLFETIEWELGEKKRFAKIRRDIKKNLKYVKSSYMGKTQ
jgi:hypothetical protein